VGITFHGRPGENVGRGNQFNVYKASLLDGVQVLPFQESAANSSSPQINVGLGSVGDSLVDYDVGQVKTAARLQGAEDFRKHPVLVRGQVNDAVGYGYVH
jgi:hypothetical protein